MNKTVNINLANVLFHIDEEAFNKLKRYLEAIKRSFSGTAGSDEIIADIEARIAELFQERMESERQVITMKEVDAVIQVMGQPEDYRVDEDIFEDTPRSEPRQTSRPKKLYRDVDNKYIGGVCAGLEHYLGIDSLWIRLIFIFFALATGFGFIAYILLWILVPEAVTTSQKLDMRGEPVNISNIEKKIKEGYEGVAERVKGVDYEKVGNQVKSSGRTFFDALGNLIMFFFKVIGKFIGVLLIIIGAATLIGLFVGLFTVGTLDIIHIPGMDLYSIFGATETPVWVISLLTFLAVGIPFFFLLYLGLKILINNLKSIGNIVKFSLLGLWLISIIGLVVLGIQEASAHAYSGSTTESEVLYLPAEPDTLMIRPRSSELFDNQENIGFNHMTLTYDENGEKLLFSDDFRFDITKSPDSLVQLKIRRHADGYSMADARERASNIRYSYALEGRTLSLDNFLTTAIDNKVRDQEVRVTLAIPAGTLIGFEPGMRRYIGRLTRYDRDIYRGDLVDYFWVMGSNGELQCLNCPEEINSTLRWDDEEGRIIIDEDGIDINVKDGRESFKLKIDQNGVEIKADDDNG
ncbi:phage shock protein C (PspC) family protein [Muriicola jejuensis]|uniref:PspC domain-containing protein n=1 Tax=Muriicola jejuensis TaxID=504488 RepID=A0A6P0UEK2_9FLAO|nr:PspC domain-containing protein [Muriicola jejuensis]NER10900.1 PspC domain-containing protein [Muriicola jejuensis]SMP15743.1 phage shock protein C (PspC) family protein [Muriicola jejuensis]